MLSVVVVVAVVVVVINDAGGQFEVGGLKAGGRGRYNLIEI